MSVQGVRYSYLWTDFQGIAIRGNLGSKMGLIIKRANNKFFRVGIQEPIEFQ